MKVSAILLDYFQMEDSISTGQKSLQLLGTPLGVLKAQVEEEVRRSHFNLI